MPNKWILKVETNAASVAQAIANVNTGGLNVQILAVQGHDTM
jgi:hypothetical protein